MVVDTTRCDFELVRGAPYERGMIANDDRSRPRVFTGWRGEGLVLNEDGSTLYEMPVALRVGRVVVSIPGDASRSWSWRSRRHVVTLISPSGARERFTHGFVVASG